MAEQIGIVTRTEHKGWARVAIQRTAGCSGCLNNPTTQGCRTCGSGPAIESRVVNPVGARSGDVVRVHMASVDFFKGAAVIYVLPIVFMLLGALAIGWTGGFAGWHENTRAIGGGLLGLVLGVAAAMGLDRAGRFARNWTPTIRQVVVSCQERRSQGQEPICEV